jgi:hypothetical protein
MFLAWLLVGALVGAIAATKRGFSPIVGLLAGAVLGILSPLLFFVSGVTTAGDLKKTKCPHCAEVVQPDAKLCKHCHQPLAPKPSV